MKHLPVLIAVIVCNALTGAVRAYEIVGYAPRFVGEKVTLYTYQDYVTMTRIEIGHGMVSPEDSLFHLELKHAMTIKGVIEIARTEAELYLAPETSYDVYFPAATGQPNSFQNKKTELIFFGLDSTDINYRIIQYNSWFDMFVSLHQKQIGASNFHTYLDTFKVDVGNAYKDVKDEYFLTYVRYNIAEMDQTFDRDGETRLNTYLTYLQSFPVYYENDQYMRFLKRFFSTEFGDYVPDVEESIFLALSNSSPTQLMAALKKDLFLANPEIRELMMVDKLGKAYYSEPQFRENIIAILDSLAHYARYEHSAIVARNVLDYVTSLEPGFPAPYLRLDVVGEDDPITLDKFKGRFLYLNFFETWNETARAEMRIMSDLKKKYGEDIAFLSICTDGDSSSFNAWKAANPDLDWDIVYIGRNHKLIEDYRVAAVPCYFLIDQDGFIFMAPAPSPSPDGEYQSIDNVFHAIYKALHPEVPKGGVGSP